MRCPASHVVCAVHAVSRCPGLVWNVSAGHASHVLLASLVSADIFWPAPHSGWARHAVSKWHDDAWYVSAPHASHVMAATSPTAGAADARVPAPQHGWLRHASWPVWSWYWFSGHAVHDSAPALAWNLPASQATHAWASVLVAGAVALRCLPAAQSRHDVCAASGWYRAAEHAAHATASKLAAGVAVRLFPAAHAAQDVCSVSGWYWPVAHARHWVWPPWSW